MSAGFIAGCIMARRFILAACCAIACRVAVASTAIAMRNSRRFIRSSSRLGDDWRRVTRLDGSRAHCRCECCNASAACGAGRLWVTSDKTHIEHNETALILIADMPRDTDFCCNGPIGDLTDNFTALLNV